MWLHNLNPVILSLGTFGNFGSFEIRWYGLVYVLGFFLAIGWLYYLRRKRFFEIEKLSKEQIWDLMFYLLLGVLIGSRLFMIFWEPRTYLFRPWNLFKIWEGGMSFHGGFVGIITACGYYCKKNKLNFWNVADAMSVPTIFALALGRIANFVNGELWGRIWNGRWCVNFVQADHRAGDVCRHPSTLYAAAQRFMVFGWLWWLSLFREFSPGFVFWNFVFWEGLGRFAVDFFRENTLFLGLSLGQWFSMIMVLSALWMFMQKYKKDCRRLFNQKLRPNG